jgi:hypothetical protein
MVDKLDDLKQEMRQLREKLDDYGGSEIAIEKIVEEKVFEIKAVVYAVLVISAITLALALGAIIRLVFG